MGRPPLPIGTYGEIYTTEITPGMWMARVQFRDADGVTRTVKRHRAGRTDNPACNALREALRDRAGDALGGEITRESRLFAVADLWLVEQDRLAAQGSKERTTAQQYRDHYNRHIRQAMGELRVRECTGAAVHRFLVAQAATSPSSAKLCRAVLSGILGYAVIHKALDANPVRDAGPIATRRKPVRALNPAEILDWLAKLEASKLARRWDLPDLSRWMCATGVRIGEALACDWDSIDWDEFVVDVSHKLVLLKPEGLVRLPRAKTPAGDRVLPLPGWCVTMLKRRKLATGGSGPIFPNVDGGWQRPKSVQEAIRLVRKDAEYPWLTSHGFRRSVATILDKGGATARAIANQLGHSHVSMTQDFYMERGAVDRRNAEIIEEAINL